MEGGRTFHLIQLAVSFSNQSIVKSVWGDILKTFKMQCIHAKSLQSCLTFCNPMDCSPPGSSVHGIFQAKILEWVAIFLHQGIFLTWGSNLRLLCLLNCRQVLCPLSIDPPAIPPCVCPSDALGHMQRHLQTCPPTSCSAPGL